MLQIELKSYASDALEDAMRLAQTKAINSYSWSDMLTYLNYAWTDIYNRIAMIDSGYYSQVVKLNTKMTRLPPFVKNTIRVFHARGVEGYSRLDYRSSGDADMSSRGTYHLSGYDLFCPDAESTDVWLEYVPIAPFITFTKNNRDPKILPDDYFKNGDSLLPPVSTDYGFYKLEAIKENGLSRYFMRHKNTALDQVIEITHTIQPDDLNEQVVFISCDYPYIFITYQNYITGAYTSGFFRDVLKNHEFILYNPFDYTGRTSNVLYVHCRYNDKTGMGVALYDYTDIDETLLTTVEAQNKANGRLKELGWTPDTALNYPCPEAYRYLVARLADKLSALNESSVMGVQKELAEARYAFEAFCAKDKSSWSRIRNVNARAITDML